VGIITITLGGWNSSTTYITFLSGAKGVLLPFQESRAVNRENTHSLVTSPFTQIEFKSFSSIMGKDLLIFADVAFYRTRSVPGIFISTFLDKLRFQWSDRDIYIHEFG
jgi:hypothetical protein